MFSPKHFLRLYGITKSAEDPLQNRPMDVIRKRPVDTVLTISGSL